MAWAAMGGCSAKEEPDECPGLQPPGSCVVRKGTLDNFDTRARYSFRPVFEEWDVHTGMVIGEGASGTVFKASNKVTGQMGALKILRKKKLLGNALENLRAEVNNYLCVDHPHIARLLHVYECADSVSLIMECCDGKELFDALKEVKRFSEYEAQTICYQALLAIAYLHKHNFVHCDITLQNFIYAHDGCLKLIDFGLSKKWDCRRMLTQAHGTLSYTAPEVFAGHYNNTCDLWSFGVVTFLLLSGRPPFPMSDRQKAIEHITKCKYTMRPEDWKGVSNEAMDFVAKLLVLDPNGRMSADECFRHPWIQALDKQSFRGSPRGMRECTEEERTAVINSLNHYTHETHIKRAALAMIANHLDSSVLDDIHAIFLMLDTDKSGTITHDNFNDFIHGELTEAQTERLFKCIDVSHHGEISYSDFVAALLETRVVLDEQKVRDAFKHFNVSGTGRITRSDLKALIGPTDFDSVSVDTLIKECNCDPRRGIGLKQFEDHLFTEHAVRTPPRVASPATRLLNAVGMPKTPEVVTLSPRYRRPRSNSSSVSALSEDTIQYVKTQNAKYSNRNVAMSNPDVQNGLDLHDKFTIDI